MTWYASSGMVIHFYNSWLIGCYVQLASTASNYGSPFVALEHLYKHYCMVPSDMIRAE